MIVALKAQLAARTTDYESMASDMAKIREKMSETQTQYTLSKDQLRMVEEALKEVRASKQEDE